MLCEAGVASAAKEVPSSTPIEATVPATVPVTTVVDTGTPETSGLKS